MARTSYKNNYMRDNLARNIDVREALKERPTGEPLREYRGELKKQRKMSMGFLYVAFLGLAVVVLAASLVSYLKLQNDITTMVDDIAYYEQTLNNLTLANDDEYSKIVNAVDYDYIRKVAIEELGMVYASEDQIVSYTRENSDYVRQLTGLSD
ncbi:MAG: cell division protein FtsL [Lachnospiraceae bacterium]|nr:cell division protein FtsL [Lachnospiraceae bacterium]MBR5993554.1 cell division protein FtsL [Lachnospiraceae bacterium]